jgi:hypothetical protein
MRCEDYRKGLPGASTRVLFVDFLNEKMSSFGVTITVAHLRELEKGRRVPSLQLALGIEKATGGAVSVREWPGLPSLMRH